MHCNDREKEIVFSKIWCRGCDVSELSQSHNKNLAEIANALAAEVEIEIAYKKFTGEESIRSLQPVAIGTPDYKGNYYLIAYCYLRQDYRTFKISRISGITVTNKPLPPVDIHANFMQQKIRQLEDEQKRKIHNLQSDLYALRCIIIALVLLLLGSCIYSCHNKKDRKTRYIYKEYKTYDRDYPYARYIDSRI